MNQSESWRDLTGQLQAVQKELAAITPRVDALLAQIATAEARSVEHRQALTETLESWLTHLAALQNHTLTTCRDLAARAAAGGKARSRASRALLRAAWTLAVLLAGIALGRWLPAA